MRGWNVGVGEALGAAGARGAASALDAVRALGASATQTAHANKESRIFARAIARPFFVRP
jgi:hypothetical protein